jgi:hypothetical protein
MKMFDSVKEVMLDACKENGNTPIQELIGCISMAALIPTLWLFMYMCGAR